LTKIRKETAKQFFTSEFVIEGHHDKLCDQIPDAVLDAILRQCPVARVACEVACAVRTVLIMGEISTCAVVDITVKVCEKSRC
jgi:S-adenosylmethionine synthetase